MKQAKGKVKELLRVICELQGDIGTMLSCHNNDRSQTAFTQLNEVGEAALRKCYATTSEYDPNSYDPALEVK